jgi:hypothetical protein
MPPNLTSKQIHQKIREQIQKRIPLNPTHWDKSTTPAAPSTEQSLQALYQLAFIRKKEETPFFGFGKWKNHMEWIQKGEPQ